MTYESDDRLGVVLLEGAKLSPHLKFAVSLEMVLIKKRLLWVKFSSLFFKFVTFSGMILSKKEIFNVFFYISNIKGTM